MRPVSLLQDCFKDLVASIHINTHHGSMIHAMFNSCNVPIILALHYQGLSNDNLLFSEIEVHGAYMASAQEVIWPYHNVLLPRCLLWLMMPRWSTVRAPSTSSQQ